jgi:hypothetical protein
VPSFSPPPSEARPPPSSTSRIPTPPPSVRLLVEERAERASHLSDKVRRALVRALPSEAQRLFALTLLVGVVCGVVAVAFHLAIHLGEHLLIDRAFAAPGPLSDVLVVLVPTVGGLAVGACLTYIVPGARGSGIPQVKQAFAEPSGRVRLRDAVGKFILGAVQIGSGASLGREGPTVQICAGASSSLARMARLSPLGAKRGSRPSASQPASPRPSTRPSPRSPSRSRRSSGKPRSTRYSRAWSSPRPSRRSSSGASSALTP